MIGLFAIVRGFEASRYIGVRFPAEQRITTIFRASDLVGDRLPWLLLLAAVASQTSAIIGLAATDPC